MGFSKKVGWIYLGILIFPVIATLIIGENFVKTKNDKKIDPPQLINSDNTTTQPAENKTHD